MFYYGNIYTKQETHQQERVEIGIMGSKASAERNKKLFRSTVYVVAMLCGSAPHIVDTEETGYVG